MDLSAPEVRQLDDRLHEWERKKLFEYESVRPTNLRSTIEPMLTHADRFRAAMLSGETGRAWGIFMGVLRFHYSTLGEAIEDLCEGMDVTASKQDLQKKSSLFHMVTSVFQESEQHASTSVIDVDEDDEEEF